MRDSPHGDGDNDGAREEARVAGDARLNLVQPRGILGAAAGFLPSFLPGFLTRSPRLPEPPPLNVNPAPPQVSIQAAHQAAVETQQKEVVAVQVLLLEEAKKAAAIKQLQLQRAENTMNTLRLATAFKAWVVPLRTAKKAARAVEASQRQQQLRVTQAARAAAAVAAATAAVKAREDMMLAAVAAAAAATAAAMEHAGDSGDIDTECEVVSERSLDAVLEENKEHAKCTGDFFDFTGDEGAAAGGGGENERQEETAAEDPEVTAGTNVDSVEVISPKLPAKPYTSIPKPQTLNPKP
jgi:hypothetical protein